MDERSWKERIAQATTRSVALFVAIVLAVGILPAVVPASAFAQATDDATQRSDVAAAQLTAGTNPSSADTATTPLVLTDEEQQYLRDLGTLRFGFVDHNLPISAKDSDGDPTGVVSDMIPLLEEYLGIPIEPICYDTSPALDTALSEREIDAAFPVYSDVMLSESKGLVQTDAIISDRVMIIFQGEDDETVLDRVAISDTGLGQRYFIAENYPDSVMIIYPDRYASFDAVKRGDADCLIGCASVMQRFLKERDEYELWSIAYLDGSEDFSMATSVENTTLTSILQKATKLFDGAFVNDTMISNSYVPTQYDLSDVLRVYAVPIIAFILVVLAGLVAVFIAYRRRVRAFNVEQAKTRVALEAAVKEADKANAAKTTFLSSMSHDIRTPMNGIIGMTAIAEANLDDRQKVSDCLLKISSSSHHLLALINEILDVSKIESGKVELTEEPFSLTDMMGDLIDINSSEADARKQSLVMHIEDLTHDAVLGDRVRLQQVFTNLVGNAIKYTGDGGHIEITLTELQSTNATVGRYAFTVQDDGIGISEEYLPHLFEVFTRDSIEAARKQEGSGLGLPIARSIVRMMNGDIIVETEEGAGSRFEATVYLKLQESTADAGDISAPGPTSTRISSGNLREITGRASFAGYRALLAEDNDINAEIAIAFLEMTGLAVDRVSDGKQAVEAFDASEPGTYDCIFMDVQMPVMDGHEATRAIRSLDRDDAQVPIFAMTADAFADDIQASRVVGMDEHFTKPLDFDTVVTALNRYFGD